MLNKKFLVAAISSSIVAVGCSSRSVTPDVEELNVQRVQPSDKKCESLGPVTGSTMSAKGTPEQALEDMKKTAAMKNGNYLWVKQYSDAGTSVTGEVFNCP